MKIYGDYVLAEPGWLFLLLAIPLLAFLGRREGTRAWLIYPSLRVLGTLGWKPKEKPFRFFPLILPLLLIPAIIGAARPQEQKSRSSRTASGIDILVALDVSQSMSARDFVNRDKSRPRRETRFEAAKNVIAEFIKRRPDDRIGLVTFSGRPYTAAPITLDHNILRNTIKTLALVGRSDEGGTAIGSAIMASGKRLDLLEREAEESDPTQSKIIVLVTDGANNSGQIAPLDAADIVAELGIKVYPIAIGSGGREQEFDPATLKQISEKTNGDFYHARGYLGLREAFASIDEIEKTEVEVNTWLVTKELYPWFVGASVILLLGFLFYRAINPPPMP